MLSGVNWASRMIVDDRLLVLPLALGPHEVLGVDDTHDVIDALAEHRDPAEAGRDDDVDHIDDAGVRLHRDHVGPGHHDIPDDGVAEVDDGVNEGAFLLLDHVLGDRLVGDGPQHLVRRVRTGFDALAREDGIGDGDEGAGHPAERLEGHQRAHHPGAEERRSLGVLDRPRLGSQLGQDEDHHHFERRRHHDTPPTEGVSEDHPDEGGGHQGAELEGEQDDRQDGADALDQAQEGGGAAPALLHQRLRLGLRGPGQRRLRQGQDRPSP